MFQTFTGREYLAIDIASNFGLDKVRWDERLKWFNDNEANLENLLHKAKEPALYHAGVQAWRDVQDGKPIGYMISLDATSSGLQFLAALTGDHLAARLCNVVDTGEREDAYEVIYQEMIRRTGGTAKIDREGNKQAIMTALYSSTAVPKEVYGEGALLDIFYKTMNDLAPGAWELNEAMLGLWNPTALSHDWVLPDNFHVKIKVMARAKEVIHVLDRPIDIYTKVNAPMAEGRSLGANTIHSIDGMVVREMTRRCDYDRDQVIDVLNILARDAEAGPSDPMKDAMLARLWDHYKQSGYLSARILDYITAQNVDMIDRTPVIDLIESMPKRPFKVVSIHDCFRCLPHYGNDLRRQYNLQLALIAKSNLLSFMISQIVGKKVTIGKLTPSLHKQITDTNYALS